VPIRRSTTGPATAGRSTAAPATAGRQHHRSGEKRDRAVPASASPGAAAPTVPATPGPQHHGDVPAPVGKPPSTGGPPTASGGTASSTRHPQHACSSGAGQHHPRLPPCWETAAHHPGSAKPHSRKPVAVSPERLAGPCVQDPAPAMPRGSRPHHPAVLFAEGQLAYHPSSLLMRKGSWRTTPAVLLCGRTAGARQQSSGGRAAAPPAVLGRRTAAPPDSTSTPSQKRAWLPLWEPRSI
jgi:hypothetical protein